VWRPSAARTHRRSPPRPDERVVDVHGHHHVGGAQAGIQPGHVDPVEAGQGGAAGGEVLPCGAEQPRAEGLNHPGAAVGARAAADAEHQVACDGVQGGQQELAGAGGRRGKRGRPAAGQPAQARCLGHLHDGMLAAQGEAGLHRLAGRAAHHRVAPLVARGDGGVDRSVPAVGDGQQDDLRTRAAPGQAATDRGGRLRGRQAALELVRRHQHA